MDAIVAAIAKAKAEFNRPINTAELAFALADQHHLTKKKGKELIDDLVDLITSHLKKGERVKIAGLGILQVRNRAARPGRNPVTGEPIQIKAGKKIAFRVTKELKIAI
jgi:DNA-binding protein HU-beta